MNSMTLQGIFNGYIWRDEMNGRSIFRLFTKTELLLEDMYQRKETINNYMTGENEVWYEAICVCEAMPSFDKGTPICVDGCFVPGKDRLQLAVTSLITESSDDFIAVRYIASFPGIDLQHAKNTVAQYGNNVFSYVSSADKIQAFLCEQGVKEERASAFLSTVTKKYAECDLFMELKKFHIPYPYVIKAVKLFGSQAKNILQFNPYRGIEFGLTFKQCDKMALAKGMRNNSPQRIRCVTDLVMSQMSNDGHTYTPIDEMNKQIIYRLNHGGYEEEVPPTTVGSIQNEKYRILKGYKTSFVIDRRIEAAETRVAENVSRLCVLQPEPYRDEFLPLIEQKCGMKFGTQQRQAFDMFRRRGVKILTGGPGTGKTTTVKGIIYCYQMMHPEHKIKLAAPTGRAAQRLAESTEMPATTVHKLLEYVPYGESPTFRDAKNPIDADFIVIDEVSMMDIELFDMFLAAVKNGTTILLVGDIHQLESVCPGAVLRDLLRINIDIIDSVFLTEVYRQKGDSPIIDNSVKINEGRTDLVQCLDFVIARQANQMEMFNLIKQIYIHYEGDPFDIQILCPTYKGESGIDALNEAIREEVNKDGKTLTYGSHKFRVKDKIIMARNNPDVGYFNGDIGFIADIREDGIIIDIRGTKIRLDRECYDDLKLAYAITIHRSQGSEFKNVIVALPKEPRSMLVRNLFYTAVTRAKKRVIIVTEGDAMENAINTDKADVRRTRLTQMVEGNKKLTK